MTFTVTTTGTEFTDQMTTHDRQRDGKRRAPHLEDLGWVLSLTIFDQPEVLDQPKGVTVWWGYGLYPDRNGDFVKKRMVQCTGAEILEEILRQRDSTKRTRSWSLDYEFRRFGLRATAATCSRRKAPGPRGDQPRTRRSQDIAFTFEYSARTAWEAVHLLLKRGPAPPPVYQGQLDPKALLAALQVFVG